MVSPSLLGAWRSSGIFLQFPVISPHGSRLPQQVQKRADRSQAGVNIWPRSDACHLCSQPIGQNQSRGPAGVRGNVRVLRRVADCKRVPHRKQTFSWHFGDIAPLTSSFQCYHYVSCHLFPSHLYVIFFSFWKLIVYFCYCLDFKILPRCAWLLFFLLWVDWAFHGFFSV